MHFFFPKKHNLIARLLKLVHNMLISGLVIFHDNWNDEVLFSPTDSNDVICLLKSHEVKSSNC